MNQLGTGQTTRDAIGINLESSMADIYTKYGRKVVFLEKEIDWNDLESIVSGVDNAVSLFEEKVDCEILHPEACICMSDSAYMNHNWHPYQLVSALVNHWFMWFDEPSLYSSKKFSRVDLYTFENGDAETGYEILDDEIRRDAKWKNEYVYGLYACSGDEVSPRTIRYIGRTKSPSDRLKSHLSRNDGTKKCEWVHGVLESGGTIEMVVLDRSPIESIVECEARWINHYIGIGHRLYNTINYKGRRG